MAEQDMQLAEVVALKRQMEEMRAKHEAEQKALYQKLKAVSADTRKLGFKVSEKKAVTVTGLRRFGVTLYKKEWERIFAQIDELKTFITNNDNLLSHGKDDGANETV